MLKDLISPDNMRIATSPIIGLIPFLSSFHSCSIVTSAVADDLYKTVDLETEAGLIYMLHEDHNILKKEYDLLKELESRYFRLLYQESYDPGLGPLPVISSVAGQQDCITITVGRLKDYPREDVYQYFKEIVGSLKPGGKITVPREVYEGFPYGLAGMVMIFRIMNLEILLPVYDNEDLVMVKALPSG